MLVKSLHPFSDETLGFSLRRTRRHSLRPTKFRGSYPSEPRLNLKLALNVR